MGQTEKEIIETTHNSTKLFLSDEKERVEWVLKYQFGMSLETFYFLKELLEELEE